MKVIKILLHKVGKLWNHKTYLFVFSVFFIAISVYNATVTKDIAIMADEARHNRIDAYYWLSPTWVVIQTSNSILFLGGILASVAGVLLPNTKNELGTNSIKEQILFLIKATPLFFVVSIISTLVFEILFVQSEIKTISFQVIKHSSIMFIVACLFILFWCLIGYGLRLTLKYRIVAVIVGPLLQIFEIYILFIKYQSSFLRFLPTALSRQFVVYQYPFWEKGSWAALKNVQTYANSPIVIDERARPIFVSYTWIVAILLWYLMLVFLLPVVRIIYDKHYKMGIEKKEHLNVS